MTIDWFSTFRSTIQNPHSSLMEVIIFTLRVYRYLRVILYVILDIANTRYMYNIYPRRAGIPL